MIALQAQRGEGAFGAALAATRRTGQLDVVMDNDPVVPHLFEPGVGRLVTGGVEPRGPKDDVETLPLTGRLAGVIRRCGAADTLVVDPPFVHAAAVVQVDLRFVEAVENLNLVAALEIDPRVGPFGHHELDVQLAIAVAFVGIQIACPPGRAVDHHALTRIDSQPAGVGKIGRDPAGGVPVVARARSADVPAVQIGAVEQRLPAVERFDHLESGGQEDLMTVDGVDRFAEHHRIPGGRSSETVFDPRRVEVDRDRLPFGLAKIARRGVSDPRPKFARHRSRADAQVQAVVVLE